MYRLLRQNEGIFTSIDTTLLRLDFVTVLITIET